MTQRCAGQPCWAEQQVYRGNSKSAIIQHQETTGHIVAKISVLKVMTVVEKEVRKAYKKVT